MPAWFRDGTESPVERRVFSCIYAHFPQTQEETAATAPGFVRNQEQWRENKPNSAFRRRWEELARRLLEEQDRCGLRVERFEDGRSAEPVRA